MTWGLTRGSSTQPSSPMLEICTTVISTLFLYLFNDVLQGGEHAVSNNSFFKRIVLNLVLFLIVLPSLIVFFTFYCLCI